MKYSNIPIAAFILFAVSLFISPKIYSDVLPEGMSWEEFIAAEEDSTITMDSIRNQLSSDGEWIKVNQDEIDSESVTDGSTEVDDDINTDYVWRPNNVPEDWNPYTNGYWTYTTCGWMWVSYYSWGWRPYHYGRWWWSPRWGWVWSPGYIWGPAWVVWMFWDNYCGWYPLSPRVRWHHHHHRYYCGGLRFRVKHWTFVPRRHFAHVDITQSVIVDPNSYSSILQKAEFNSSIDYTNGTVINPGPSVTEIEKSTGKKYEPVDVKKYNTSKTVNEYVNREVERENKEDVRKKEEVQRQQEVNSSKNSQNYETPKNNNETKSRNEDSRKENNSNNDKNTYKPNTSTKQNDSYKEKPKEYTPKQNNESRQNNESKQNNESRQKNNDSKQNNESKQKSNDSYNSNRNNNNNNKTTAPRNEQKSNDNQSNKNNNSGNKNNNSKNNDSKDGDAQNNKGNRN